uniref:Cytochrome b5 heme-binding domain-containing protein n=1 Tax=Leptocylindrus aporus TaxID=1398097 RepID=A0A7S0K957_9STRA|mmetsp:Transcript_1144/g.1512  ORF Transcript_1144/g.1512 Transcript_1144/m.1512 type:complete len:218 (+) Transcript_1144:1778-2431(+)
MSLVEAVENEHNGTTIFNESSTSSGLTRSPASFCCSDDDSSTIGMGSCTQSEVDLHEAVIQSQNRDEEEDEGTCDACPFCQDTCMDPSCAICKSELVTSHSKPFFVNTRRKRKLRTVPEQCYTMCQVRRHNTRESAWLVADGVIYDATPFLSRHPGGERSILKYSGGVKDCSEDLNYHSKNARNFLWPKFRIGVVVDCPCKNMSDNYVVGNESCILS